MSIKLNFNTSLAMQTYRKSWKLLIFFLVFFPSACNSSQTPSPPIPVTLVVYDSQAESTTTTRPIRTLILPSKTGTLVSALETQNQTPEPPVNQTPVHTVTPLSISPSPTETPISTSDLLYLSGPRLMRWDHVTNYTTSLAENVVEYSANSSGDKIALLRSQIITANGLQLYNLDILDLRSKQIHTLVENSPSLYQLSISPDGSHIVYLPQNGIGQVLLQSTIQPYDPKRMGECHPSNELHCKNLYWSPDSRTVAWSDSEGVWTSSIRNNTPRLVITNQVDILDPENLPQVVPVTFDDLQWSPVGRFILAQVIPSLEGVRWYGIIDTLDGRLVNIPDSSQFARSCLGTLWTITGDLFITHGGYSTGGVQPNAKLWRVIPTRNDLLVLAENTQLNTADFPEAVTSSEFDSDYCIFWLNQLDVSRFNALIEVPGTNYTPTIYQIELKDGSLREILGLPPRTGSLLWSPDGFGALVLTLDEQIYFAYISNGQVLLLSELLGAEVKDFFWLPPMPRE